MARSSLCGAAAAGFAAGEAPTAADGRGRADATTIGGAGFAVAEGPGELARAEVTSVTANTGVAVGVGIACTAGLLGVECAISHAIHAASASPAVAAITIGRRFIPGTLARPRRAYAKNPRFDTANRPRFGNTVLIFVLSTPNQFAIVAAN